MKPADLARALEGVPEKRLRLVELVPECVDSQGQLDFQRCIVLQAEIAAAVEEALQYGKQTRMVVWALQRLLDR